MKLTSIRNGLKQTMKLTSICNGLKQTISTSGELGLLQIFSEQVMGNKCLVLKSCMGSVIFRFICFNLSYSFHELSCQDNSIPSFELTPEALLANVLKMRLNNSWDCKPPTMLQLENFS